MNSRKAITMLFRFFVEEEKLFLPTVITCLNSHLLIRSSAKLFSRGHSQSSFSLTIDPKVNPKSLWNSAIWPMQFSTCHTHTHTHRLGSVKSTRGSPLPFVCDTPFRSGARLDKTLPYPQKWVRWTTEVRQLGFGRHIFSYLSLLRKTWKMPGSSRPFPRL